MTFEYVRKSGVAHFTATDWNRGWHEFPSQHVRKLVVACREMEVDTSLEINMVLDCGNLLKRWARTSFANFSILHVSSKLWLFYCQNFEILFLFLIPDLIVLQLRIDAGVIAPLEVIKMKTKWRQLCTWTNTTAWKYTKRTWYRNTATLTHTDDWTDWSQEEIKIALKSNMSSFQHEVNAQTNQGNKWCWYQPW